MYTWTLFLTVTKKYDCDVHLAAFPLPKLTLYFGCNAFILICCDCSHWTRPWPMPTRALTRASVWEV